MVVWETMSRCAKSLLTLCKLRALFSNIARAPYTPQVEMLQYHGGQLKKNQPCYRLWIFKIQAVDVKSPGQRGGEEKKPRSGPGTV